MLADTIKLWMCTFKITLNLKNLNNYVVTEIEFLK